MKEHEGLRRQAAAMRHSPVAACDRPTIGDDVDGGHDGELAGLGARRRTRARRG